MKEKIKNKLFERTGCGVQNGGWPCNTCFHDLKLDLKEDIHIYWQAVLALRGDYPEIPQRPDLIQELYEALNKKPRETGIEKVLMYDLEALADRANTDWWYHYNLFKGNLQDYIKSRKKKTK